MFFRSCEIHLGTMLDIHEKLLQMRDRMDKLRSTISRVVRFKTNYQLS